MDDRFGTFSNVGGDVEPEAVADDDGLLALKLPMGVVVIDGGSEIFLSDILMLLNNFVEPLSDDLRLLL